MTRDIEADIKTFLLADATIAGLVGDRIYANLAPLDTSFPNIVYTMIAENDEVRDGYYYQKIRFSCWAQNTATSDGYTQVKTLVAAVKARMVLASTFSATLVQTIGVPNPKTTIYGKHLHYDLLYKEV